MSDQGRCPDCGRPEATDADWRDPAIEEGDRDDLCWGFAANCDGPQDPEPRPTARP